MLLDNGKKFHPAIRQKSLRGNDLVLSASFLGSPFYLRQKAVAS